MPQLDIVIFYTEYVYFLFMFYVLFDLISFFMLPIIFSNLYVKKVWLSFSNSMDYSFISICSYINKIDYNFIDLLFVERFVKRSSLLYVVLKNMKTYSFPWLFFEKTATWKNVYYYFLFTMIKSNHYILLYPYFKGLGAKVRSVKFKKMWSMLLTFYMNALSALVCMYE